MSISIRNRLPGTIEKIVSDKVVSEVVIRTAAGTVTSIITTGSAGRMNLKEGDIGIGRKGIEADNLSKAG
jgi:molybdopterin-binding protein